MIVTSDSQIPEVLAFIENSDKLAFDIETTGLCPIKDKIIGFGISNDTMGYYITHLNWTGSELKEELSFSNCKQIIESLNRSKLLMWNGSFDIRFTKRFFGVDLTENLYMEGMAAKHTVDEDMPFRLKDVAKKRFGVSAIEEQKLMKESIKANGGTANQFYKADLKLMAKYCIWDCVLTYKLCEYYKKEIQAQELTSFYFDEEVMPLYKNVVIPMEHNGVCLDMPALQKAYNDILVDIDTLQSEILSKIDKDLTEFKKWFLWKEMPPRRSGTFTQYIAKYANWDLPKTDSGKLQITKKTLSNIPSDRFKNFLDGGEYLPDSEVSEIQHLWWNTEHPNEPMFNLSSKHHLKKLFFEKYNEEPLTRTPKGAPQVNDDFLSNMAEKYEWVKLLQDFNKLNKLKGSYLERFLEKNVNGRFYPSWFVHRTTSGRFGGDLMQLPRPLEPGSASDVVMRYNNLIRHLIIAGSDRKLVGADYSSLEVVVFADDAGDEPLLNMIRNDEDFYSSTAISVYGLESEYSANKKADNFLKKLKPELRQASKVYSLGLRYGMQSFKLSKTLNIKQKQAQDIINKYFESYPKLQARMQELISFAKQNGYVRSKAGRTRHLPLLKSLSSTYGDMLADGLKIWEKYNSNPTKYKQMKYLGTQYRQMINNCLNFPIQSMAASITNRACIAVNKEFKKQNIDAYICMQVHDEIVVNCSQNDTKKVAEIVENLMENTTKLSVPLTAKPEIGDKYGEIK